MICPKCNEKLKFVFMFFGKSVFRCNKCRRDYTIEELEDLYNEYKRNEK